jgi:hypothetical protein
MTREEVKLSIENLNSIRQDLERKILHDFQRENHLPVKEIIPMNLALKAMCYKEQRMKNFYEEIDIIQKAFRSEGFDVKQNMQNHELILY